MTYNNVTNTECQYRKWRHIHDDAKLLSASVSSDVKVLYKSIIIIIQRFVL